MPAYPQDLQFMRHALQLAGQAASAGEVPVGAVVVKDGAVVGVGRNNPIHSHDPTAHAEILALRDAAKALGNYRLEGCTLYVTLEPCAMCCGAILHARIQRVVFGAVDAKTGCAGSVTNLFDVPQLNHQTEVQGGVLAQESTACLQSFFVAKRADQRAQASPVRQDALRTPDACFAHLAYSTWPSQYVDTLPVLSGLRMHYLDVGPRDAESVLLCLHPIPGWNFAFDRQMAAWLEAGARVIAPDLIGFGKSDKPKRPDFHSVGLHVQSLLQLLDCLHVQRVHLVCPDTHHVLADPLMALMGERVGQQMVVSMDAPAGTPEWQAALRAPYPDAGHRAGERAFLSKGFR